MLSTVCLCFVFFQAIEDAVVQHEVSAVES